MNTPYTLLLEQAIKEFLALASERPLKEAVYVATMCGGISEKALYVMVGGCFRRFLEQNVNLRLKVDKKHKGSQKRPDYIVYDDSNPNLILLAVEFKLLSDSGYGNGGYRQKLDAIKRDFEKLEKEKEKAPSMEMAVVVFFIKEGTSVTSAIEKEFEERGFRSLGETELWTPKGMDRKAKLQVLLNESSEKFGNSRPAWG